MSNCAPVLSTREHQRLADIVYNAVEAGRTLAPLTAWYPELTGGDACRIRDLLLERRLAAGEQVIGAKISLGSAPGARPPDPRFSWLTDRMLLADGTVDVSALTRPRAEPKLAFRLARPLRSSVLSASDLLGATESVMPCVDILDSRFEDGSRRLPDDVAENGATTMLVLGDSVPPPPDGHLLRVRVHLRVDGPGEEPVGLSARGRTRVPALEAVSWLGGRLVGRSLTPGPGTLLVSQALGAAVELSAGVRLIAHFSGLGTVKLDAIA
jgi:2-oxopent-4-enoate/cis-2-oxohex-4-enoate hydratase